MDIDTFKKSIESQIPENIDVEGSADKAELECLASLASDVKVKLIAEIGFNAGYSSYNFLSSNPTAKVVSFDIGNHTYVSLAKEQIDKEFPDRHTLILGDSTETVPTFTNENPDCKFDLIFIDGGHDYNIAKADLINMRLLAHEHTILVTDDLVPWLPWGIGPTKAWAEALNEGIVMQEKLFRDGELVDSVEPPGNRSWVIGKYILNS